MSGIVGHGGFLMGGNQLWTPAQLGPRDWFSPSSAVTDAGGGACSRWDNLRGSRHLVQATSGSRPTIISSAINGLRAIRLDGTDDHMTMNSSTDLFQNVGSGWVFAVFKKVGLDGAAAERCVFFVNQGSSSGTTRFGMFCGTSTEANRLRLVARRQDGDSAAILNADTLADTSYHMVLQVVDWTNGDGFSYLDGNSPTSNTSFTSTGSTTNSASVNPPVLGRLTAASPQSYADIEVAELIIGRGQVPGSDDVDRLFGYAAHEFALTGNLPGGHPYISSPP
jgi:hypothetical protein